jgi:hypothetical protein
MRFAVWVILLLVGLSGQSVARAEVVMERPVMEPGAVRLQWRGGNGPYGVDVSGDLHHWSGHGEPVFDSLSTLPAGDGSGYFRVRDLDPDGRSEEFFGLIQTQQSEFGSLMGLHRLKMRLWLYLTKDEAHTSANVKPAEYWRHLRVYGQFLDGGQVRTWSGAWHELGVVRVVGSRKMTVAWTRGSGAQQASFLLTLDFPYVVDSVGPRRPLASDPTCSLRCTYASPQPEFDSFTGSLGTTLSDSISLIELSPYDPANPQPPFTVRRYPVTKNGVTVNLHFFEGLPLYQGEVPWIIKTYPFDRWLSPTTAGGGSLPAFTTDSYFARTVQPGHHNFYETVLIEPGLDPTLPRSARDALAAANIRQIWTLKDLAGIFLGEQSEDILYIGFDGSVRPP